MIITAGQVKKIRELTGLPIMQCKKALSETAGDISKSIEWLKKTNKEKITVKNHTGKTTAVYCVAGMIGNQAGKP